MNRTIAQLVLAFLALAVVPLVAQEGRTIIKADTVITMTGEPISPGQVVVVDGKIKSVSKARKSKKNESAKVIELGQGSVLMPGLVDAYSQTGLGSAGTDEYTNEVTPGFKAIHSVDWDKPQLKRSLLNGTTTMCVCPGRENVFAGISAIIKTGNFEIPLISDNGPLVTSLCNDPCARNRARNRPDTPYTRQPTNRMGVVWILRTTFDQAQRSSENEFSEVKESLDGKRPLMVYSRMSYDLTTVGTLADEFGFSPIIVGGHEAYKVKEFLAERKYPVILGATGTNRLTGDERSELCWNNAGVLDAAGITVALSGDDLLERARFAHRNGLGKEKSLKAITTTPAELLGISDRVGSIKPGLDADLVALSGNPLELTTSIQWVMVDGHIVGNEAQTKTTESK